MVIWVSWASKGYSKGIKFNVFKLCPKDQDYYKAWCLNLQDTQTFDLYQPFRKLLL